MHCEVALERLPACAIFVSPCCKVRVFFRIKHQVLYTKNLDSRTLPSAKGRFTTVCRGCYGSKILQRTTTKSCDCKILQGCRSSLSVQVATVLRGLLWFAAGRSGSPRFFLQDSLRTTYVTYKTLQQFLVLDGFFSRLFCPISLRTVRTTYSVAPPRVCSEVRNR